MSGALVPSELEIVFVFEASPECGYEAHALGYSIFTQGDSLDELREMAHNAVRCYLDEGAKFSIKLLPVSARNH